MCSPAPEAIIYISVMTIVSSVRQLVETPIYAMNEGTSPILSYNYGARRPARVRKAMLVMSATGSRLHSHYVERHPSGAGCADPDFQL